ncbi:MAG: pyridoxal-phosphate dependent enzyme [Candidatus Poribacteria bacterium]|nr:pyridoxal-phosphate dependent enzyme [Candidatus Poribacteria bacterium]
MMLHVETPVFESLPMSEAAGKPIFLKMECFQPTGSFKIRGLGLLCKEYVDSGISHLVSSSGGNAGFAVAYAGSQLGVDVTVVVPETTASDVRHRIEQEGATVVVHGAVWDESHAFALSLSEERHGAYIPPFDHPTIWRGHATMVDELVDQCKKPDVIILSVGGGGLLCGLVEGLERHGWQDIPIVAVETEGASSLASSIAAGRLVTLDRISSVATSLGAKQVGIQAFEYAQRNSVVPFVVTDAAAIDACMQFAEDHRILVEPACGASLSVVYDNADVISTSGSALVIVCGGIGVSIEKLLRWKKENSI